MLTRLAMALFAPEQRAQAGRSVTVRGMLV